MLKFAKFIGANTDFATAQAFLFPRVLSEGSTDPVFGLVITGEGEDIFVAIRQKILSLEENFNAPFERITDKLHSLLETLKVEFRSVKNLELTLFCARDNLFYVLQTGNSLVEILSGGNRSPVIQNDFSKEKIISGLIKPGDRILVLSSKLDGLSWSDDVVTQVFSSPFQSIPDAEVIFTKDEQGVEEEGELTGVKNIQPVAFILVENEVEGTAEPVKSSTVSPQQSANPEQTESREPARFDGASARPKAESGLKLKLDFSWVLLGARRIIRQGFGAVRLINKKILIVLILIVVFGLVGLGGYLYFKSQESQKNTRRDNLITLIDTGLAQASAVKGQDQKAAIEELKRTSEKLKELESLDPDNTQVHDTRRKFDEKSNEILRIYNNVDLELFMSLDLIKSDFQTKRMSFSVDKILVLDETEKSLVSIGIDLKSPNILAGRTQLGEAKLASINGSSAYTFSADKGLIHVDLDTEKSSVVSAPDAGWGNVEDIFGFSGNVYALDTGQNMIWKYAPIQSGYSQKQAYLKSEANLSQGKRLIIDYSVWVLSFAPDVLKFTAGNSDFYAISGVDEPVAQIDGIYVTEELDSVFLLDKSKNRILVTKKNGEYIAQYIKPELGKVDDFFVDETGKAIYLLIENKIYKTPLR